MKKSSEYLQRNRNVCRSVMVNLIQYYILAKRGDHSQNELNLDPCSQFIWWQQMLRRDDPLPSVELLECVPLASLGKQTAFCSPSSPPLLTLQNLQRDGKHSCTWHARIPERSQKVTVVSVFFSLSLQWQLQLGLVFVALGSWEMSHLFAGYK